MVGNIGRQCTGGGQAVEGRHRFAEHIHRGCHARHPAGGGGLHIAFYAGHLARKADARIGFERVSRVQQARRIQKCVAVHDTVAHELGVFQRRNHGEHALLLTELEVSLAADQIVQRAVCVVAAQLQDRIRILAGFRVRQADRLEDTEPQRIKAAACVDLDGHAALEHRCFLGGGQRIPEGLVLLAGERAVDVIRRALAVA